VTRTEREAVGFVLVFLAGVLVASGMGLLIFFGALP